jgi:hypothetical protein
MYLRVVTKGVEFGLRPVGATGAYAPEGMGKVEDGIGNAEGGKRNKATDFSNLVLVICYFRFIRDELFVAPKSAMTTARMPSFSEGGLQKKFLI